MRATGRLPDAGDSVIGRDAVFGMREGMVTYFDAYNTKREALESL